MRVITDAAGGIVDRANYRPYGEQLGFVTVAESKGYIGERLDDETGLMYLHARYYDPVLARFVSADPSDPTFPGVGVNRYAYAANNPILHLDPSGLWIGVDDLIASGVGAVAGLAIQVGVDVYHGEVSSLGSYAGAVVGGAAAGEAALYTGGLAAGAAGGAAYSVTQQLIDAGTIDVGQLATDTALGAVGGKAAEVVVTGAVSVSRSIAASVAREEVSASAIVTNPAAKNTVKEGIYEFPDQMGGNAPYAGQSANVPRRLAEHETAGRLSPGTETTTEVLGGKTAREIAEHSRIQQLTGGQKASKSSAVSNQRDPIGPDRRPGLGLPEPRD